MRRSANDQPSIAHNKIAVFLNGMVRVVKINVKRITEDAGSFLKRNPMLLKITF